MTMNSSTRARLALLTAHLERARVSSEEVNRLALSVSTSKQSGTGDLWAVRAIQELVALRYATAEGNVAIAELLVEIRDSLRGDPVSDDVQSLPN